MLEIFRCLSDQIDEMIIYLELWDKLRVCCGQQMSKYWRNELLPIDSPRKDLGMKNHSFCGSLDVDDVEGRLMDTKIYRLIDGYENLRHMNSPSTLDPLLTGTYCSSYNDIVREQGIGFGEKAN